MNPQYPYPAENKKEYRSALVTSAFTIMVVIAFFGFQALSSEKKSDEKNNGERPAFETKADSSQAILNTELYDQKIARMANGDSSGKWPVKHEYPLAGAILPLKTIVAYYGNLYSKQMGILGELPKAEMLEHLKKKVNEWQQADSSTEIQPALHYIAVTAQSQPGKSSKYRLRMPFHQIDSVLSMAKQINAVVFLDIQVGLSTLQEENSATKKNTWQCRKCI
ncbi:MAG: hypothetical protein HC867_07955, partial [Bacteroidia bacterium]|nr:hypothetical protein [Bacteroidia bacterium]